MSKYVYNEHDRNQVEQILKARKQKRRKRKRRFLLCVLLILLVAGFFISDYSKVQTVNVVGNNRLTKEEVIGKVSVKAHKSIALFASTSSIEKEVEKINLVKEALVNKDLVGNITIEITETKPIAYQSDGTNLWIIDEKGNTSFHDNLEFLSYVQRCPRLVGFDQDRFSSIAKEYCKLPSQVQNQISDIKYAPLPADDTRTEFSMDDGKILMLRIEDMANQLAGDRYANIIKDFPGAKYYDFQGKYCYTSN